VGSVVSTLMRIPSVFEKALITFLDNDATGGSICRAETLRTRSSGGSGGSPSVRLL